MRARVRMGARSQWQLFSTFTLAKCSNYFNYLFFKSTFSILLDIVQFQWLVIGDIWILQAPAEFWRCVVPLTGCYYCTVLYSTVLHGAVLHGAVQYREISPTPHRAQRYNYRIKFCLCLKPTLVILSAVPKPAMFAVEMGCYLPSVYYPKLSRANLAS